MKIEEALKAKSKISDLELVFFCLKMNFTQDGTNSIFCLIQHSYWKNILQNNSM